MRIVGSRQGVLGSVRVEELLAPGTTVLRILQMDVPGTPQHEVTHIMQHTRVDRLPKTRLAAVGTGAMREVAAAPNELCLRQIGRINDPFSGIRQVLSRPRHDNDPHGQLYLARNLRHFVVSVIASYQ